MFLFLFTLILFDILPHSDQNSKVDKKNIYLNRNQTFQVSQVSHRKLTQSEIDRLFLLDYIYPTL